MYVTLILVFHIISTGEEVKKFYSAPIEACTTGEGVQSTIAHELKEHPELSYDPKSGWKCQIGQPQKDTTI